MFARYGTAITIGVGVTFGLLFVMQLLIATGRGAIVDGPAFRAVDFVRVERDTTDATNRDKPERPPEPDQQPDVPQSDSSVDFDGSLAVEISVPTTPNGVDVDNPGFRVADGEYLPIVMVAPIYPARAAARGFEGHVIVEYTVTRTGTTRDARVVESSSNLFERAAVESALKYKYKPRVINGEPVEVPAVRTIIRFELEN